MVMLTLLVLVFKALIDAANSIQLVIVATQLYQNWWNGTFGGFPSHVPQFMKVYNGQSEEIKGCEATPILIILGNLHLRESALEFHGFL